MEFFDILAQNQDFVLDSFNFTPALLAIAALAFIDLGLKAWAMWRAARMSKLYWFIALLLINSMGILPVIFLFTTKAEYALTQQAKK